MIMKLKKVYYLCHSKNYKHKYHGSNGKKYEGGNIKSIRNLA